LICLEDKTGVNLTKIYKQATLLDWH